MVGNDFNAPGNEVDACDYGEQQPFIGLEKVGSDGEEKEGEEEKGGEGEVVDDCFGCIGDGLVEGRVVVTLGDVLWRRFDF